MTHRLAASCLAVATVLSCSPGIGAWGFDAHRYITEQAIALLPPDVKPFFEKNRAFVIEHSVDPDLWRSAGFQEEPPRHFLDLDAPANGPFPFAALPREDEAAVAKFGKDAVDRNGTLPWRLTEFYGLLVKAFEQQKQGTSPWALENAKFYAAALSHYAGDAHMPLHAVTNYDGQLTTQQGVHARFESDLFVRYRDRLVVHPAARAPIGDAQAFAFDTLLDSYKQAEPLLAADRAAIGTGLEDDDAYFERFFAQAKPILEGRLSAAVSAVAALITGAWEAAGRPDLAERARVIRRKRPGTAG